MKLHFTCQKLFGPELDQIMQNSGWGEKYIKTFSALNREEFISCMETNSDLAGKAPLSGPSQDLRAGFAHKNQPTIPFDQEHISKWLPRVCRKVDTVLTSMWEVYCRQLFPTDHQVSRHPSSRSVPTYPSSRLQAMIDGDQALLDKGAVIPVPRDKEGNGLYLLLFLVPKHDSRLWPVLDLKALNKSIVVEHFKMTYV